MEIHNTKVYLFNKYKYLNLKWNNARTHILLRTKWLAENDYTIIKHLCSFCCWVLLNKHY